MVFQIQHLFRRQREGGRVLGCDDQEIDRARRERINGDHRPPEEGLPRRLRFHEGRDPRRFERLARQLARAAARAVNIEFHVKSPLHS